MFAPPASETCVLLLFFSTSLPFTSSFSVSRSSLSLPLSPPKRVLDCLLPGGILLADKLKQREKETTEEGEEEALFSTWHSRSFGLIAKQHANYPHTLTYSLFFVYRQHHSYPKLEQDLRIKKSRKEDRGFFESITSLCERVRTFLTTSKACPLCKQTLWRMDN